MTEFDKKLLFELDTDGRKSYTEIAKTLQTSPQVVKYHLEKLQDEGIIKHFWAFIDYDKAGYHVFWGYWLKFAGLTKETEAAMYNDFRTNKNIPIVMRCDGYADAMLGIIGRDVFEHNAVLQNVFAKYGQFIAANDVVVGLSFHKFSRAYLIGGAAAPEDKKISGGAPGEVKLSDLDRKILSLLQIDGRMEFTRIAKKLNVAAGLVQKHFVRMQTQGVITKITYTPDYEKMGMTLYRVLFKITQFNSARVDALLAFCAQHPNIINYVTAMGNWQLMVDIEIDGRGRLRELLRTIRHEFKDIVSAIEINEVYNIDKFTQMAMEYPELGN